MISQNKKLARFLECQGVGNIVVESITRCPFQIQSGAEVLFLRGATHRHAKLVQEALDIVSDLTPFSRVYSFNETEVEPGASPSESLGRGLSPHAPTSRLPQPVRSGNHHTETKETKKVLGDVPQKKKRRVEIRRYALPSGSPPSATRKFTIIVDHRERTNRAHASFAQWMRTLGNVTCVDAQLASGDFMFMDTATRHLYPAVVERKTLADLAGSIITPRLNQQKRLMNALDLPLTILLVEGNLRPGGPDTANLAADDLKRIHSAIATASAVNGFNVFHCPARSDTLHTLTAIGTFLSERFSETNCSGFVTLGHIGALRDIIELKSVFPSMLANITGCSSEAACEIAREFGSPIHLHAEIEQAMADPHQELQFVRRVLRHQNRQKMGSAELPLMLMNLFGNESYNQL